MYRLVLVHPYNVPVVSSYAKPFIDSPSPKLPISIIVPLLRSIVHIISSGYVGVPSEYSTEYHVSSTKHAAARKDVEIEGPITVKLSGSVGSK